MAQAEGCHVEPEIVKVREWCGAHSTKWTICPLSGMTLSGGRRPLECGRRHLARYRGVHRIMGAEGASRWVTIHAYDLQGPVARVAATTTRATGGSKIKTSQGVQPWRGR